MAGQTVSPPSAVSQLSAVLDSPEIGALIAELEATRWTGRPGFPIRAMVGMALVRACTPSRHGAVPPALWQSIPAYKPHSDARRPCTPATPFTTKLREHSEALAGCLDRVIASLRQRFPEMGRDVAIDESDMPTFANGQRFLSKDGPERERFSDPDASWGHRSAVSTRKGGGYYGYKVHAAVCAATDLPLAWTTETAKDSEQTFALGLLDAAKARGFEVRTAIRDKGYDVGPIHDGCMDRGVCPVTSLKESSRTERGGTSRRLASTAPGRSLAQTSSGALPSGAARLASASPCQRGLRPTVCIR